MRFTVRQLQLNVEEQLNNMTIRMERAERNCDELHDRIDRSMSNSQRTEGDFLSRLAEMRRKFDEDRLNSQRDTEMLYPALSEEFTETARRFRAIEQRLDRMEECNGRVEQRLDRVEQRLDQVEQCLDQVEQRLDRVEQRLDRVDQRLDRVDQRLEILQNRGRAVTWLSMDKTGFRR